MDAQHAALLARYVDAFERYDMDALTSLLREDAAWNMPPYAMWLQTHQDIVDWCLGPGIGCEGSRLVPIMANGTRAYGQYKPDPAGGLAPWSVQVLEVSGDRISGITFFLDTAAPLPAVRAAGPPRRAGGAARPGLTGPAAPPTRPARFTTRSWQSSRRAASSRRATRSTTAEVGIGPARPGHS